MNKITLVTGIWDIGRGELTEGWSRSYKHYLDKFEQLLKVEENLIIYGDAELRTFVNERRPQETTQFIERPLKWFTSSEFFPMIQKIRTNPEWYGQVGWLQESTQCRLENYNPLVMSKMFLLHDAKIMDRFDSEYLFWIDGVWCPPQLYHYLNYATIVLGEKKTPTDGIVYCMRKYARLISVPISFDK